MQAQGKTLFNGLSGLAGSWIFLGLPFSLGTVHAQTGTELAADQIRQISYIKNFKKNGLVNLANANKTLSSKFITDLGNFEYVTGYDLQLYFRKLSILIGKIIKLNKRIITIGGDHSLTYALLMGIVKEKKSIQVLHIDAHQDMQKPNLSLNPTHADFISRLLRNQRIERIFQLGVRGFSDKIEKHRKLVRINHLNSVDMIAALIDKTKPIYISFDVDAIDPSEFFATNFCEPDGLSMKFIEELITFLIKNKFEILGIDIMEYNPTLDKNLICGKKLSNFLTQILIAAESSC